jgi:hypothetical protein
MNDHDNNMTVVKIILAWLGTIYGGVTLSSLVLGATLIFTLLNIFILVRDKIWRDKK